MATLIHRSTGENTAQFGFRGTDLGYFVQTNHGYVLSLFGDTFDNPMPGGPGWRSPVILRTHNTDLAQGVRWDNAVGGARAKQAIDYVHEHPDTAYRLQDRATTQIPNDAVHLPDGRYLMSTFLVRSWERHGDASWLTWCNRLHVSHQRDAEVWEPTRWQDVTGGPVQFNNEGEWSKFQNCTFTLWPDGYLYMFGTQSGRYDNGGIYLARVRWENWDRLAAWEFWGWTGESWAWGTPHATPILTPTVPGTAIGEISSQVLDGQVVLSYMDYGIGAVTRTAVRPDSVWTDPQVHTTDGRFPRLYAPSLHPYSTLERPYMHLSQWTSDFYGSNFLALDAIQSAEPVAPDTPSGDGSVEGTDLGTCRDLSRLTAEELAQVLTQDTNVSAEELLEAMTRPAE